MITIVFGIEIAEHELNQVALLQDPLQCIIDDLQRTTSTQADRTYHEGLLLEVDSR